MIRHDGSINQEMWDVTNPTNAVPAGMLISKPELNLTHHIWWECDTGIAYVIAQ